MCSHHLCQRARRVCVCFFFSPQLLLCHYKFHFLVATLPANWIRDGECECALCSTLCVVRSVAALTIDGVRRSFFCSFFFFYLFFSVVPDSISCVCSCAQNEEQEKECTHQHTVAHTHMNMHHTRMMAISHIQHNVSPFIFFPHIFSVVRATEQPNWCLFAFSLRLIFNKRHSIC